MSLTPEDQQTLSRLEEKRREKLQEVQKWTSAINAIYELAGEPPPYEDAETPAPNLSSQRRKYGPSEFYGKPLQAVVRTLLEDQGGLTDEQIFALMVAGGFKFAEPNEKARNNLKISLGKSGAFDKTTSGVYVLAKKSRNATSKDARDSVEADEESAMLPRETAETNEESPTASAEEDR